MKLLALVGSPRPKGNTNYLVEIALAEAAKSGIETDSIILSQHRIGGCQGHVNCGSFASCRQKDDGAWILDRFCQADGVILATPVYYYNVSAQMKAFIDRNYYLYKHGLKSSARAVGVIVVAEEGGIKDTLHTLTQFIGESFSVGRDRVFYVSGCASKPGEAQQNAALVEAARDLGRQMTRCLRRSA